MPIAFLKKLLSRFSRLKPREETASEKPSDNRHRKQSVHFGPTFKTPFSKNGFYGLGLSPALLKQTDALKFHTPTPIQHKTIPMALEGKDIVGIAQTGTGKTLAFGLPLIQRLASLSGRALILAPTRELALQINEALLPFLKVSGLTSGVFIGGASMDRQINVLRQRPRVLIATPGRLIDLMERGVIKLQDTRILVLDEADRMLDMGFMPQIIRIMKQVPKERQTLLFSATMPPAITAIAGTFMKLPIRTEVAPSGTAPETVKQELYVVDRNHKMALVEKLLASHSGSVLVFTRTKAGAARLAHHLKKKNHGAAEIHSDRSLSLRTEALEGFKKGKYRILVATDIAARGIDVTGIELVINYDLPDDTENYIHRIGRTGRAGLQGHAISIACPEQGQEVADIEQLIKTSIAVASHPEIPSATLLKGTRRTIADLLFGPPKGRKTGRERPITPLEERAEHKREWGR